MLRSLDDHELEQCTRNQFVEMGSVAFFLVMIPVALATISTTYVTNLMDMVLYTGLSVFLIVTYVIFVISVPLIIILSAVFGGVTVYYYGIFAGAVRRASRLGTYVDAFGHVKTRRHPTKSQGFDSRRQSLPSDVSRSVFYALVALVDLFAYLHVLFSPNERQRLRAVREVELSNSWRMMNALASGQTATSVFELEEEKKDDEGRKSPLNKGFTHVGGMNRAASLMVNDTQRLIKQRSLILAGEKGFPAEILAMQPTGTRIEVDHAQGDVDTRLVEDLFGVVPVGHWGAAKGERVLVDGQPATVAMVNADKSLDVVMDKGQVPRFRVRPTAVQPWPADDAAPASASAPAGASTLPGAFVTSAIPVLVRHGAADTYAQLYRDKTESTTDAHTILRRMLVSTLVPCP